MPIYNETPEALWKAIESVRNLEYELDKVHLYLAFDDDTEPEAFKYIMQKWERDIEGSGRIIEIYDKINISVCRFAHGGKKSAQQGAYNVIKSSHSQAELKDSFLFFIDSDIQLKSDALWQFVRHMEIKGKNCLTGMITCVTSEKPSFLSYYQDIEYISGQIFWRNMEDRFGATSCLPGAFTILRWTSFDGIADEYFEKTSYSDNFEYQRFYLGEDRYLTHLLMEKEPWKMGFCESARCKTEAPDTLIGLLKQRRRWFLGHISNDTWMLSSLSLWRKYPLLTLFNFLNNSRNTSIYIYLLYFVIFLNKNVPFMMWFLYIMLPIVLNWFFIMYYALTLKRKMNVIFYLMIVVFQPIFSMMFMYYTIYTIRQKSWGGVRVERSDEKPEMVEVIVQ
jgi:cellulose synthase/poly-beta-1,6-N-acetylglucosamine synthase-like glycosyltransferase